MYTEPTIVNADRLKCKGYVTFYLNGIRHRVVSGRPLGLRIFPNRAKTVESRRKGLEWLREEIVKRLDAGTFPLQPEPTKNDDIRLIVSELSQLKLEIQRAINLHVLQLSRIEAIQEQLAEYLSRNP